ncbi:MAG: type I restriction enzyme HsdR N-terminal domain-containing protein [Flavobacteriaceae bacterium]|jgi:hypothetical protein|nr:type I restriction enzyme HsdR N-terminal domain-containing protein [Flavobacteriaceae bacterium]
MVELPILNFPERYSFQIKESNSLWYIFDEVRKKWLILTPEEWVRQHIIKYLKSLHHISNSNILIEKKVEINRQTQRLDVLIIKKAVPFLLIECKAPEIKLTKEVFEQAARYNREICAKYLLITNGLQHIYFYFDNSKWEYKVVESFNF